MVNSEFYERMKIDVEGKLIQSESVLLHCSLPFELE